VFLKGDYKITEPLVAGKLVQMRVARAVFEANNGGDFYSRDVAGLVKDIGHPIYLTATRAASNKSKETRIIQHSPAIKAFAFLDPRSELASPMYRTFLSQLTTYTMSGTNEHDDAPDSLAGLASMLRMNLNATLTVYDRKHI
jgi:predicted phage terminase large subunit-like protein